MLTPEMTEESSARKPRHVLFYLLKRYPRRSAIVVLLLVLAGLSEGFGVATLLPLLSAVTAGSPEDQGIGTGIVGFLRKVGIQPSIGVMLTLIAVGIVTKATLVAIALRKAGHATAAFAADLRLDLIRALMKARWTHFAEQPSGRLANAISSEAARASEVFIHSAQLVAEAIQVMVYGTLAMMVSWYVTLAAIGFGLLMATMLTFLIRLSRAAGAQQTAVLSSLIHRLTDGLASIKPLKSMGREDSLQPILEAETEELNRAQRRQTTSASALTASQESLIIIVLAIGVYFAVTKLRLPLDQLLFMAFLFQRTVTRIGDLQANYQRIADKESALWAIHASTEHAQSQEEQDTGTLRPTLEESIRFEEVRFSYGLTPILDGISLSIPAKRFTSIAGASGIGKTTVADLITGLLRPDEGEIWIDDSPLSQVDMKVWRAKIGYVPQDVVLFNESIFGNVSLKDPGISRADVETALRDADAWDFVSSLEEGMETTVGERGMKLSGGQRQRIAIARALVRKPELLILDEATASLDPKTERAICSTLRKLRAQVTVLAISHQPALVEEAEIAIDLGSIMRAKPRQENLT